jgi:enamine deaminase RidA (YjgF/YER057c/UK114 family)
MIRKHLQDGISYSVVESDGMRHVFLAAQPCLDATVSDQLKKTLRSLDEICGAHGGLIVMQSVFLAKSENQADCRRMMREYYGDELPATSYIPQPPCAGGCLAIEAWVVGPSEDAIEYDRLSENLVLARHRGTTWAYLADVRPEIAAGLIYDRSLSAFRSAEARLQQGGMNFGDVLRTWLYLGEITGAEGDTSRYLELNRARTDFYRNHKFAANLVPRAWRLKPVFPASTGIGAQGCEVAIGGIAIKTERPDVLVFPLENPKQTAAYDYAHQYGPESPKFARAMAVVTGESVVTFISGTASITASDTRHAVDLERQTQQTLDNIEILISSDNFARHGFAGMGATLNDLALARVYLKRPADFPEARAICQERLGDVPAIYVVGDICREELLVEIEAVAFSGA